MILRTIGIMLLLVSPVFSALLTQDLEVISPTGIPLSHDYDEQAFFTPSSSYTFAIRFVQTSRGVLLVRDYTKGGVIQLSHTIVDPGTSVVIFNSSSSSNCEEHMTSKNINLE